MSFNSYISLEKKILIQEDNNSRKFRFMQYLVLKISFIIASTGINYEKKIGVNCKYSSLSDIHFLLVVWGGVSITW